MLYLLRNTPPMVRKSANTEFYLGYCEDGRLQERLEEHRSGRGAKLTAAAVATGRALEVVWTGEGTRKDERRLKNRRHHKRLLGDF